MQHFGELRWTYEENKWEFRTSNMLKVNPNISKKEYDLLGIGIAYYIGTPSSEDGLWIIYRYGDLQTLVNEKYSLRSVVSLNSGVKISENNTGNGSSLSTAYSLQ